MKTENSSALVLKILKRDFFVIKNWNQLQFKIKKKEILKHIYWRLKNDPNESREKWRCLSNRNGLDSIV